AALRNYLARLGWSHGDDEVMSTEDVIAWFEIEDVNKGAARFDFQKLEALNGVYMRQTPDDELTRIFLDTLPCLDNGPAILAKLDERRRAQLRAAMPGLKERARTLKELADSAYYLYAERPLALDEKAAALLDAEARKVLAALKARLEAIASWDAPSLEAAVRAYAEAEGLKLGKAAQPLRAALTGRSTSPGVFDVLAVLGREESLARIADQID